MSPCDPSVQKSYLHHVRCSLLSPVCPKCPKVLSAPREMSPCVPSVQKSYLPHVRCSLLSPPPSPTSGTPACETLPVYWEIKFPASTQHPSLLAPGPFILDYNTRELFEHTALKCETTQQSHYLLARLLITQILHSMDIPALWRDVPAKLGLCKMGTSSLMGAFSVPRFLHLFTIKE